MATRREFLGLALSATLVGTLSPVTALPISIVRNRDRIFGEIQITIADYPELQSDFGSVLITIDGIPSNERCAGQGKIVVTRLPNNTFSALSARCTHQGCCVSPYNTQNSAIVCSCHGSRFDADGTVLQGPATQPLTRYPTQFDGQILTISIPGLVNIEETEHLDIPAIVSLSPNPCAGEATLRFTTVRPEQATISITSLDGKLYHRFVHSVGVGLHTLPLQLWDLPSGIYIVHLQLTSGPILKAAITVQR